MSALERPFARWHDSDNAVPILLGVFVVLWTAFHTIVYAPTGSDQINVGTLQQDPSVIAYVDIEEMLSKHFAVLGSTGVGKSTGVSLLLNEILQSGKSVLHD